MVIGPGMVTSHDALFVPQLTPAAFTTPPEGRTTVNRYGPPSGGSPSPGGGGEGAELTFGAVAGFAGGSIAFAVNVAPQDLEPLSVRE
jgi:hypothetical protein